MKCYRMILIAQRIYERKKNEDHFVTFKKMHPYTAIYPSSLSPFLHPFISSVNGSVMPYMHGSPDRFAGIEFLKFLVIHKISL